MKNIIKKLVEVLLFFGILITISIKVSGILASKQSVEKYSTFYEENKDFDVIFMGTSRMYNSVLPQEIWKEYNITSYNWGFSNSTLAENYYILQDVLRYSSPKVIVVDLYGIAQYELYGNGKWRDDRVEQQHIQFDSIPISKSKIAAVKDVFNNYPGRIDFLLPFFLYHYRWNELTKDDFLPNISTEKGAEFLSGVGNGNYFEPTKYEIKEIHTACAQYIKPIIDLCKDNNVELLFTYNPGATTQEEIDLSYSVGETLKQYDANYLSSIYVNSISSDIDFFTDNSHLNYAGARKYSILLGEYLQENYHLRSDSVDINERWAKDYNSYRNYKIDNIKQQKDLYTKLMLLYGGDLSVEINVDTNCKTLIEKDVKLQKLIDNLEKNSSVKFVDNLTFDEKKCQLTVKIIDNYLNFAIEESAYNITNEQKINMVK